MQKLRLSNQVDSQRIRQLWKEILEKPEKASGYKQVARLLCQDDKHRQAARVLRIGLKNLPDDRGLLENLARTLQQGGFSRSASRIWLKITRQHPDSYLAFEKLERHYVRAGQPRKAVNMYRRVGEDSPLKEKSLERIVFVCKEAMDVPGTLRALKKLVRRYGVNFRRCRDLGRFHFKADNFREAARWLEKCFTMGEGDPELRLTLALSYARQKKFSQAEKHIRRILRDKPGSFAALITLCELKIDEGNLDRAGKVLEEIESRYPKNSRAQLARGEILLGEGNVNEAEECIRSGIRKTPYYYRWELERGYRLLHRARLQRGDKKEAGFYLLLADALHPAADAYQAFIKLAEAKIKSHELATASEVVKILNRMFPSNSRVLIARAEIELLKGYPLRAIELLNNNLEKTPVKFVRDKIRGYRVLARAYKNLGDWKGAWQSSRQARAIETTIFPEEKS